MSKEKEQASRSHGRSPEGDWRDSPKSGAMARPVVGERKYGSDAAATAWEDPGNTFAWNWGARRNVSGCASSFWRRAGQP